MSAFLERNLLALSATDPGLAARVTAASPSSELAFTASRTGLPIPYLNTGGTRRFLHSAFDPMKEARRIHETNGGSYLVFLGYGAGYHLLPYIESSLEGRFLVLDRDITLFRSVLEQTDQLRILMDRRIHILIDPAPDELREYFLSTFLPVLEDGFATVSLRPRIETDREFFSGLLPVMQNAMEQLAGDYAVQRSFGKRWLLNTLRNLPAAEASSELLAPVRSAVVTAAGPSLESGLDAARSAQRTGSLLIATDTSLPTLLAAGIEPDVAVSIDCQLYSYHHFLKGIPERTILVLDLASPPILARLTRRTLFFTSGHPFSRLLNARWRAFPAVDTSGGNVTHSAVSLAGSLGAQRILLLGADYAYPRGKLYSRDSYLYTYFRTGERRNRPLESDFYSFLLRDRKIRREPSGDSFRYRSDSMDGYRENLESLLERLHIELSIGPGEGVPPSVGPAGRALKSAGPRLFCSGAALCSRRSFLTSYLADLERLSMQDDGIPPVLSRLPAAARMIWQTLLPAAAAIRREAEIRGLQMPGREALEASRIWTAERISRTLE